jgi:hypothetical protein
MGVLPEEHSMDLKQAGIKRQKEVTHMFMPGNFI